MTGPESAPPVGSQPPLVRSIAFYLPQFHPIPENDAWWGEGFTEWSNVRTARPRFPGHYQPHIPGELGYYDLREEPIRERQAQLAATHGVYAFCYYHYWFAGRQVLERPLQEVLSSGRPDFPFCIAWANENWTRAWDGGGRELLLEQQYSRDDDLAHIRHLRQALTDPRYVTFEGKPVLLIYRASLLPDPRATTDLWREEAASWGLSGLYLARIESFPEEGGDPRAVGFDAAVDFQPKWRSSPWRLKRVWDKLDKFARRRTYVSCTYDSVVNAALSRRATRYPRWPCVTPMWDNSARRRGDAFAVTDSTPDKFQAWLEAEIAAVRQAPTSDSPLLFVNAWNEWGEGCHLEPDERWGRAYLEAHLRALRP